MMSGYPDYLNLALRLGANEAINKPIPDKEYLLSTIERVIESNGKVNPV